MQLNINGNGLDNLASNADVVAGQARGNNGTTSANLRGQGSNATLILLNGRRIASAGLNGGVVDLTRSLSRPSSAWRFLRMAPPRSTAPMPSAG